MTAEQRPPTDLVPVCQRLLAESGHGVDSLELVEVLSAGAVRLSAVLSMAQPDSGRNDPRQRAVVQVSTRTLDRGSVRQPVDESSAVRPLMPIDGPLEAQAIAAAAGQAVPTATILASGFSAELDGDVLITRWTEGQSIPRKVLRRLGKSPGAGARLAEQCGESLAALHSIADGLIPPGLPRLSPEDPFASHVADLNNTLDELPTRYPSLRYGLIWLAANRPVTRPTLTLVHGDFRLGNLLVNGRTLAAILDWELAHVGDPMRNGFAGGRWPARSGGLWVWPDKPRHTSTVRVIRSSTSPVAVGSWNLSTICSI